MHDYLFFNGDSYNKGFTVFKKNEINKMKI